MQRLIDWEKQAIADLKSEEVAIDAKLSAKQAKLVDLKKEIDDMQGEIEQKEKAIEKKFVEIARYSQGNHEHVLKKVSYSPDDEVEKLGIIYKVSEFRGALTHEIVLDTGWGGRKYELTTEDRIAKHGFEGLPEDRTIIARGNRFNLAGVDLGRHYFETHWEEDGVLPSFEVISITPNALYNEATIINLESELPMDNRELASLRDRLQSREKDQQELEADITRLQDELAHIKAKLKEKGEPPQPLKPTP